MQIDIRFKFTEEYYNECYDETVKYRLKYRKWLPYLVGINFLFSTSMLSYLIANQFPSYYYFIPVYFYGFGFYEWYKNGKDKRKWLSDRLSKRNFGKELFLSFKEDIILEEGPFSKGEIKWELFPEIQETAKGIFLTPEKGVSIYLPKKAFANKDEIELFLERCDRLEEANVKRFS